MHGELQERDGAQGDRAHQTSQLEQVEAVGQAVERAETFDRAHGADQAGPSSAMGIGPRMTEVTAPAMTVHQLQPDPTLARLEYGIAWYDREGARNQQASSRVKASVLIAAATMPLFVGLGAPPFVVGGLAVVIVLLEGLQQLHQYERLGLRYRSIAESLKREKFLFLAGAHPYNGESGVIPLLAERVEVLVAQEHPR
jgi:Protein of unknown function (DUF4231)